MVLCLLALRRRLRMSLCIDICILAGIWYGSIMSVIMTLNNG